MFISSLLAFSSKFKDIRPAYSWSMGLIQVSNTLLTTTRDFALTVKIEGI